MKKLLLIGLLAGFCGVGFANIHYQHTKQTGKQPTPEIYDTNIKAPVNEQVLKRLLGR